MYFTIKQEKNMLVATDRPLELSRGLELLEKKNQEALETKQTMLCSYELTYQGKVIYQSSLEFPIENFDLFEQIKSDLTQVSANETDVQEFIIFLAPFFPKKKGNKGNNKANPFRREPIKSETKDTPPTSNLFKSSNENEDKQVKKSRKPLPIKKIVITTAAFLFVGILLFFSANFIKSKTLADKTPSYSELIKQKEYDKAVKFYPDSKENIEELLNQQALEKKSIETLSQLKEFDGQFPTVFGSFDIAILEADYRQAISTFEGNKNKFKHDTNRLILVGYSYLKLEQLEPVKVIIQETQSIELEKKLFQYEQLTIEINELEQELIELEKGGSKNKAKAEEVINKKFKLQEERLNL